MTFPANGIGLVFVLNLLAWLEFLAISLVVFGAVFAFIYAFGYILNMASYVD